MDLYEALVKHLDKIIKSTVGDEEVLLTVNGYYSRKWRGMVGRVRM